MEKYETAKLKGRIVEKYGSQEAFANAVGCSKSYLSQYLNGKVYLSQQTIDKWSQALEIITDSIPLYFFTKRVHETEPLALSYGYHKQ